ncbi:ABC transporter permease [Bacteroidota bacterium]
MNLSFLISKRISHAGKSSFSATIHKIAIASIGLGLGIMIISVLIMYGFEQTIQNKIISFSGHIQITRYTLGSTFEELPVSKESDFFQTLNELDYVDHVQGIGHKVGLFKTDDEVHGIYFKGVDEFFDTTRFSLNMVEGKFFNPDDTLNTLDIVISRKIATLLNLKVNDDILLYFMQNPVRVRRMSINGIYESGMEEFDEKMVFGHIAVIQKLNDWRPSLIGGWEVFIKDFNQLNEAESNLFDITDYDLFVDKVTDKHIEIFDWLSLISRNVVIFLVLILFVASFNMISILIILIMERTQMIGILKAIGATNRLIQQVFVYNGMLLILKGLLLGNIIGISFGYIQARFRLIPLDPENYYMNHVPIYWDWISILGLNILIFCVVSLVLVVPTMIISRIDPVRSIRFD